MVCRWCSQPLSGTQTSFCSKRCNNRWRHNVRVIKIVCAFCKEESLIPIAGARRGQKYCSRACARAVCKPPILYGPKNGRWRGGRVLNYGPGWKLRKQEARDRDKVCRQCSKTPEENGRALDVHHISPYRYSGNNRLENLLSMCRSCHMRALDRGRRGAARFAGPQQLKLRPVSQRDRSRLKSQRIMAQRRELQEKALALNEAGLSLRQIGRDIGVSHQTVSNWLDANREERQTGTG